MVDRIRAFFIGAIAAASLWFLVANPLRNRDVALRDIGTLPADLAMVVILRTAIGLALLYVVIVVALGITARFARLHWAIRAVNSVTPALLRRICDTCVTGAFLAAAVSPTSAHATASSSVPPPVMRLVPPDTTTSVPSTTPAPSTTTLPTPTSIETRHSDAERRATQALHPSSATNDTASTDEDPFTTSHYHVVALGQNFWTIAESTLTTRHKREPTEAELHAYWVDLVAANRAELRDPTNPDLIFPGQMIRLP